VDGIDAVGLGDVDQGLDVELTLDRLAAVERADLIGLVGFEAMEGEAIFVGENGDGGETQFGGRPEDAYGDFTPVGDEELLHFDS
jgi:hypothetical protein